MNYKYVLLDHRYAGNVQGVRDTGDSWFRPGTSVEMIHRTNGGPVTVCGVRLNRERTLTRLKTNWQQTRKAYACENCAKADR